MVGNTAVYYMAACLCKGIYLNSFAVGLMKKNAGMAGCGVDIYPVQKQSGSAVKSQITITITKAMPRMHK